MNPYINYIGATGLDKFKTLQDNDNNLKSYIDNKHG